MDGSYSDIDVIIIGAGPSGCSAAIWSALNNLKTCVIESTNFPRHRPGETLHPGISVLFQKLGVEKEMNLLSKIRHSGVFTELNKKNGYSAYSEDKNGSIKGYQILRSDLDQTLLNRAKELNVKILQPCRAISIIVENERVIGVNTTFGQVFGKFIIDASGSPQWMQKQLKLELKYFSKKLLIKYGYYQGKLCDDKYSIPIFRLMDTGWHWMAKISDDIYHWSQLSTNTETHTNVIDLPSDNLKRFDKIRGADVTWRYVYECAGSGYFLTGDSCIVLDPSISRGVLRGIYSGIMASDTIFKIIHKKAPESISINFYRKWMHSWFNYDLGILKKFYTEYNLNVFLEQPNLNI